MLDAEAEAKVLAAIDLEGLLDLLTGLVEIPSVDGRETEAQRCMAEAMERLGLEVDLWEIDFDQLSSHPDFSVETPREHGLGLVGTLGESGSGRDLIFNGHIDVVPPGNLDDWSVPPWQGTRKDGRIWGRGALDMKGGLCCAVFAAHAIRDAGIELDGRLMVESVIGEEDGGCGTLATTLRGYRADGAVIPEPTELTVAPAQAGCCNFRLIVRGLSAHGCIRHEGVSALEKLWPLHRALLDFERRYNEAHRHPLFDAYQLPYPLSIGTVHAGDWASSVPDTLICEGRFGVAVDQEPGEARHELEQVVAEAAAEDPWLRENPPEVEWWGGQFAPALTDPEHPVVETIAAAAAERTGEPARYQGMTYGADMRLLQRVAETPTVMFGPGDIRRAHRPDEWVAIDDLRIVTEVLALAALRFCGVR